MLCDSPYSSYNKKKLESMTEMIIPLDRCIRADTLEYMSYKGFKHSEETIQKIREKKLAQKIIPKSAFKKGQTAWNKGMKCTWVTERNMTDNPGKSGEDHWHWSENVKYRGLHKWVQKYKGTPDTCEHCNTSDLTGHSIHWANVSLEYKRDIDDWIRLCPKCHSKFDSGRMSSK